MHAFKVTFSFIFSTDYYTLKEEYSFVYVLQCTRPYLETHQKIGEKSKKIAYMERPTSKLDQIRDEHFLLVDGLKQRYPTIHCNAKTSHFLVNQTNKHSHLVTDTSTRDQPANQMRCPLCCWLSTSCVIMFKPPLY